MNCPDSPQGPVRLFSERCARDLDMNLLSVPFPSHTEACRSIPRVAAAKSASQVLGRVVGGEGAHPRAKDGRLQSGHRVARKVADGPHDDRAPLRTDADHLAHKWNQRGGESRYVQASMGNHHAPSDPTGNRIGQGPGARGRLLPSLTVV